MSRDTISADIGLVRANVQCRGAVDSFFKRRRNAGELQHPRAPFGSNSILAVAVGDALEELFHELGVTGCVDAVGRWRAWPIQRETLLLEKHGAFCW